MSEIGLSVGGTIYKGWKQASVVDSMEQLARTFRVSYTEDATKDRAILPIEEGDEVTVKIDEDQVIKGFVDDSSRAYTPTSRSAEVSGRSLGDLVDCSAVHKGHWQGVDLLKIAQDLLDPFGYTAVADVPVGKVFRKFSLQVGETVHDALNRAAKLRGLLQVSNAEGELVFTRVGSTRTDTVLQRGKNVLGGSLAGSWKDRFSTYKVLAQAAGDDDFFGLPATQAKQTVEDSNVTRYRPLTVVAENEETGQDLKNRALWERNTRAGRARRLTYTVEGWRDEAGDLWRSNSLVQVEDDWLQIRDELLVVSATLERSMNGTLTTLELTDPAAFALLDPPKTKKGSLFGVL